MSEFEIEEAGAPNLQAEPTQTEIPLDVAPVAPGWTADEAAQSLGGLLSAVTAVAYVAKWKQWPDPELWPVIAGDPKNEFPLTGAMLAPFLNVIAPKGSAAAIGVSGGAVVAEVGAAIVKRTTVVLSNEPKKKKAPQPQQAQAAPQEEGGNFKFKKEELAVFGQSDMYGMLGIQ